MKRNTETASVAKKYRKRGAMREILHRLRKNKGAMAGAVILLLLFAVALTIDFWIDKELVIGQNLRARSHRLVAEEHTSLCQSRQSASGLAPGGSA